MGAVPLGDMALGGSGLRQRLTQSKSFTTPVAISPKAAPAPAMTTMARKKSLAPGSLGGVGGWRRVWVASSMQWGRVLAEWLAERMLACGARARWLTSKDGKDGAASRVEGAAVRNVRTAVVVARLRSGVGEAEGVEKTQANVTAEADE